MLYFAKELSVHGSCVHASVCLVVYSAAICHIGEPDIYLWTATYVNPQTISLSRQPALSYTAGIVPPCTLSLP